MVWAAVSVGVAIASTAASVYQGEKAASAQEEQSRLERERFAIQKKQADVRNIRAMRQQIRQARAARAAVVNTAASTGTATSTGALGGSASVQSQLSGAISTFQEQAGLEQQLTDLAIQGSVFAERAGAARGRASQWGALSNLGFSVFKDKGGWKTLSDE